MDDTFDFSSFGISRRETPLSQPSSSFNSTPILAATPARAPSSNASPKTLRRSLTGSSGGLKLSDFSILGKLGEGGFGTVLLARLKSTGALCAIKLLLKQCMTTTMHAERVLREARTMMDTQHPFIVFVGHRPYLVSSSCSGWAAKACRCGSCKYTCTKGTHAFSFHDSF